MLNVKSFALVFGQFSINCVNSALNLFHLILPVVGIRRRKLPFYITKNHERKTYPAQDKSQMHQVQSLPNSSVSFSFPVSAFTAAHVTIVSNKQQAIASQNRSQDTIHRADLTSHMNYHDLTYRRLRGWRSNAVSSERPNCSVNNSLRSWRGSPKVKVPV